MEVANPLLMLIHSVSPCKKYYIPKRSVTIVGNDYKELYRLIVGGEMFSKNFHSFLLDVRKCLNQNCNAISRNRGDVFSVLHEIVQHFQSVLLVAFLFNRIVNRTPKTWHSFNLGDSGFLFCLPTSIEALTPRNYTIHKNSGCKNAASQKRSPTLFA